MSKHLHRLLLITVLIFAGIFGTAASAESLTDTAAAGLTVRKEGGKSYLYNGDKAVTGIAGIKEYPEGSGNYYYFANSADGRIFRGMFKRGGKYYLGTENGTLARGWTSYKKKTYYFLLSKFTRVTGTKKIKGKHYYFNSKGVLMKGFQRITRNGTTYTYYFDPANGGAKVTGLKKISGRVYYFDKNGRMKKGLVTINGNQYYFNDQGFRSWGLKRWNGGTYYFKKQTKASITGWKTFKGKRYYFDPSSTPRGRAKTGLFTVKGLTYYANENGELQYGLQTVGGKTYYFNPDMTGARNGAAATGTVKINGTTYNFNDDGSQKKSLNIWQVEAPPAGTKTIRVNLSTNVTTVYNNGTAVRAMYCSPGAGGATPTGTFSILDHLRWHELMGPSWGQFCSHITGSILFHSIPYQTNGDPSSMPISAFNQLGQAVSHGCIRLACIDAYYIYTYCPVGTPVTVDYFGSTDPLTPPRYYAPGSGYGYDPTDPNYGH